MAHEIDAPAEVAPRVATVLDRLSPAALERVQRLAHQERYEAGAVVLHEGRDTPFLGAIEAGRVALRLRVAEWGDRLTLVTIEPSELIGWSAVVPPYRVTVDAIATEPTRILAIEATALRELLATDCGLAAELLPLVLESVSARLTASWHQLLDVFGVRVHEPW
jgi:CRP/FNR family transcriptional regulator, cyclic AMP receptor protein